MTTASNVSFVTTHPQQIEMQKPRLVPFSTDNIHEIQLKFTVGDYMDVPLDTRRVQRMTQAQIDAEVTRIAEEQGMARLAEVGRLRPGMKDTGQPLFYVAGKTDEPMRAFPLDGTSVGTLPKQLAELGFTPKSLAYQMRVKKGKGVHVVILTFNRLDTPELSLTGQAAKDKHGQDMDTLPSELAYRQLEKLLGQGAWRLFGYSNPDGTITLNLIEWNSAQKKFKNVLCTTADGKITVAPPRKE